MNQNLKVPLSFKLGLRFCKEFASEGLSTQFESVLLSAISSGSSFNPNPPQGVKGQEALIWSYASLLAQKLLLTVAGTIGTFAMLGHLIFKFLF